MALTLFYISYDFSSASFWDLDFLAFISVPQVLLAWDRIQYAYVPFFFHSGLENQELNIFLTAPQDYQG